MAHRRVTARYSFVDERGRSGREIGGNVPGPGVLVELRPEGPEAGPLEAGLMLARRGEAEQKSQVVQVEIRAGGDDARRKQLLGPHGDRASLPQEEKGDLADVLARKKATQVCREIVPQLRRARPLPAAQGRIEHARDREIGDLLELVLLRALFYREASVDAPADGIPENVAPDAVEENGGSGGQRFHEADRPRVLRRFPVNEDAPGAVFRHVLFHAVRVHDRVREPEVAGHLAREPAVEVTMLPLEKAAGERLEIDLPVKQAGENPPAVEAAAQRQHHAPGLEMETAVHRSLEGLLDFGHTGWPNRPRAARQSIGVEPRHQLVPLR